MLKKNILEAINDQIKNEIESAYLYLSMAAHFSAANLNGFAHWMRIQWQEELSHALKLFDHIGDRGGRVTLKAIAEPPREFGSPLSIFQKVAEHERQVTAMIDRLYELAMKESDHATQVELQWFVREQVEEEKNVGQIVELLKLAGDQVAAILSLDRGLAARKTE